MMEKLRFPGIKNLPEFLKRSKYVLIMVAAGILLLLLPAKRDQAAEQGSGVSGGEESFSVEAMEARLGEILSRIDGAGEVSVMLTVRSGTRRILAVDRELTQTGDQSRRSEETVILSTDNGEQAVSVGQNYPEFQGVLAVCPGGDDPEICLKLTRALASLTGLSSGKITVCKGS